VHIEWQIHRNYYYYCFFIQISKIAKTKKER